MRVAVHVTPRAGRDEVVGWQGSELGVRVTAAPEGGKANEAVSRTMASALGLPKSRVRVVRGHSSRHKSVEIDADPFEVQAVFGEPEQGLF